MNRLDAARLLGVSRSTFDKYRQTPGFPAPKMLPARKKGRPSWDPEELKAWRRNLPDYSSPGESFKEQTT